MTTVTKPYRLLDHVLDNARDADAQEIKVAIGAPPMIMSTPEVDRVPGYRDPITRDIFDSEVRRLRVHAKDSASHFLYYRPGAEYRVIVSENEITFFRTEKVVPKSPLIDSMLSLIPTDGSHTEVWLKRGERPSFHVNGDVTPITDRYTIEGLEADDLDDELRAIVGAYAWTSFLLSQHRSMLVVHTPDQIKQIRSEQNPTFTHTVNGYQYELTLSKDNGDTFLRATRLSPASDTEGDTRLG